MHYVGRGLAFGGGVLASAMPCLVLYMVIGGPLDPAWGWARSLLFAMWFAVLGAMLGGVLFTASLMKLRHFPWRQIRYSPRRVAAALGVLAAVVGIAGSLLDAAGGFGAFALASLVAALVCKRVVF